MRVGLWESGLYYTRFIFGVLFWLGIPVLVAGVALWFLSESLWLLKKTTK
jgi:hypothetical protein